MVAQRHAANLRLSIVTGYLAREVGEVGWGKVGDRVVVREVLRGWGGREAVVRPLDAEEVPPDEHLVNAGDDVVDGGREDPQHHERGEQGEGGVPLLPSPRPAPLPDKVATPREGDRDPIQPLVARRVPHRLPFGISGGVRGDGTLACLAYLSSSSSTGWCVGDPFVHCWCETLCLGVGALRPTF